MTIAAERFIDLITWDSYDCYITTAKQGLSETDSDALAEICSETEESYVTAESEIMTWVRKRAAELTRLS